MLTWLNVFYYTGCTTMNFPEFTIPNYHLPHSHFPEFPLAWIPIFCRIPTCPILSLTNFHLPESHFLKFWLSRNPFGSNSHLPEFSPARSPFFQNSVSSRHYQSLYLYYLSHLWNNNNNLSKLQESVDFCLEVIFFRIEIYI